jgi:hypothetical protein
MIDSRGELPCEYPERTPSMQQAYDPHGAALLDCFRGDGSAMLICFQDGVRDDVPASFWLRETMDRLEVRALDLSRGHVLDVGAGAGLHSLELQRRGLRVAAIDIASDCITIMRERGVLLHGLADGDAARDGGRALPLKGLRHLLLDRIVAAQPCRGGTIAANAASDQRAAGRCGQQAAPPPRFSPRSMSTAPAAADSTRASLLICPDDRTAVGGMPVARVVWSGVSSMRGLPSPRKMALGRQWFHAGWNEGESNCNTEEPCSLSVSTPVQDVQSINETLPARRAGGRKSLKKESTGYRATFEWLGKKISTTPQGRQLPTTHFLDGIRLKTTTASCIIAGI